MGATGDIQHWSDGWGTSIATEPLAFAKNIWHWHDGGAQTWFVSSVTGSASGAGTRESPLATIAAAVSAAASADVIILMAGHVETLTANLALSKRLYIIGEGVGSNRPQFIMAVPGNVSAMTLTAAVQIRGIRFAASTISNSANQITATAAGSYGSRISHCEFTQGVNDASYAVNGTTVYIDSCAFVSSATSHATRPYAPVSSGLLLVDCTFTGGVYGWAHPALIYAGWGNSATGPIGFFANAGVFQCAVSAGAYFDTGGPDQQIFENGLGLAGHPLISNAGLFMVGSGASVPPYFVDSTIGTDGAGYGKSRSRPFATLKYAITTGGAVGMIVVGAGHRENIPVKITYGAQIFVIGEGTGDNRPLFTRTADIVAMDMDSQISALINVRWAKSTVATTNDLINPKSANAYLESCEFTAGENDAQLVTPLVASGAHHLIMKGCSFIAGAATRATVPPYAIDSQAVANLQLINCSIDSGQFGWTGAIGAYPIPTYLTVEGLSLLRDSRFQVSTDETNGLIQLATATGTSGIVTISTLGGG
jgi:hypothetical protein